MSEEPRNKKTMLVRIQDKRGAGFINVEVTTEGERNYNYITIISFLARVSRHLAA